MGYNSKELKVKSTAKKLAEPKDAIVSQDGQYKYAGQITKILGNQSGTPITMKGVSYPVRGKDNLGNTQMMYPGAEYFFPGSSVTEYPMKRQLGGPTPPEDWGAFLAYNITAPENRQAREDWTYGDPNQYDHYGMWDALGKPSNFEEALKNNPDWTLNEYDDSYHGFSVNPNTGVWLKDYQAGEGVAPGSTGWMEANQHYLNPESYNNFDLVYDPELQRMRYVPKQKRGGSIPIAQKGMQSESGTYVQVDTPEGVKTLNTDSDEYRKYYANLYRQVGDVFEAPNMLPEATVTGVDPRSIDPMTGERFAMWDQLPEQYKQVITGSDPMAINARNVARQGYVSPNTYLADVGSQLLDATAEGVLAGVTGGLLGPGKVLSSGMKGLKTGYGLATKVGKPIATNIARTLKGSLATSLPGLSKVPGATVGNALTAGFAGSSLYNIGPNTVEMYNNPSWENAGKIGIDLLNIAPVLGTVSKTIAGSQNIKDAANLVKHSPTITKDIVKESIKARRLKLPEYTTVGRVEAKGFDELAAQKDHLLNKYLTDAQKADAPAGSWLQVIDPENKMTLQELENYLLLESKSGKKLKQFISGKVPVSQIKQTQGKNLAESVKEGMSFGPGEYGTYQKAFEAGALDDIENFTGGRITPEKANFILNKYQNNPLSVVNDPILVEQYKDVTKFLASKPNLYNPNEAINLAIAKQLRASGKKIEGTNKDIMAKINDVVKEYERQKLGIPAEYLPFEEGGFMKKGGSKKLKINSKFTNKNIQSSINELFKRNEMLFGSKGKKYYKPFAEGGSTNNTNMKKLTDKEIAFPQQPTAAEFYARGFVPNSPVGFYRQGGMSPAEAYPQQPPADMFFSGYPFQPQYMRGGMTNGIAFPQQPTAEYFFSGFPWESKYETGGSSSSAPQDMNSIDAQIGNKKNNLLKFLQSNAMKAIAKEEAQKVKQQMMPQIENYFNEGGYFDQAKPVYEKDPYIQRKMNVYQTMADDSMAGLKSGIPELGLQFAEPLGNVFDKPQEEEKIVSDQYTGTGPNVSTKTPYEGTEVEVNPSAGNFDWNSPGGFAYGGYPSYAPGGEWTWADEWEQKDKAAKLRSAIREKQGAQWQALPADMSYEDLVALAAKEGIIKMSDVNQGTQAGNLYPVSRRGIGSDGYGGYRIKIKGNISNPIFPNINQGTGTGTGYPNMSNLTPEQQAAMKKEYADMGYDLEYTKRQGLLRSALGLGPRMERLKITKRPGAGSENNLNSEKSSNNKNTYPLPLMDNPDEYPTIAPQVKSNWKERREDRRINRTLDQLREDEITPTGYRSNKPQRSKYSNLGSEDTTPEEKYGELSPVLNIASPTTQGQIAPLDFYINPSLEQAAEENAVMPNQKYGGGFNNQRLKRFFPGGVNRADKLVVTQRGPSIFNPYATEAIMQGLTGVLNNAQQRKASQAMLAGLQGADATFVKDQPYDLGKNTINEHRFDPYREGAKTTGIQSFMDANINPGIQQSKYGGQGQDAEYIYMTEEDINNFMAMGGTLEIFE